jgi:hypothetical protein
VSAVGLMAAVCDACGVHGPAATDLTAARVASTTAGWALTRVSGEVRDYCPEHVGTRTVGESTTSTEPQLWVCPECEQGKHGNCDGWAWDFDADEKTQCQCPVAHP